MKRNNNRRFLKCLNRNISSNKFNIKTIQINTKQNSKCIKNNKKDKIHNHIRMKKKNNHKIKEKNHKIKEKNHKTKEKNHKTKEKGQDNANIYPNNNLKNKKYKISLIFQVKSNLIQSKRKNKIHLNHRKENNHLKYKNMNKNNKKNQ